MAFASVFLVLSLLAVPAVYGADHTVGGSGGWDQGVDFATWAAGEKFVVGDNLGKLARNNYIFDIDIQL